VARQAPPRLRLGLPTRLFLRPLVWVLRAVRSVRAKDDSRGASSVAAVTSNILLNPVGQLPGQQSSTPRF
jgi:hypothetical protein